MYFLVTMAFENSSLLSGHFPYELCFGPSDEHLDGIKVSSVAL